MHGRHLRWFPLLGLAAVLVAAPGCSDWQKRVRPGLAVAEPTMELLEQAEPIALTRGHTTVRLVPRARYSTKAWVVAVDDDFSDPNAEVMPLDVGLAWGVSGDPALLGQISFHLKRRYLSARWDTRLPIPSNEVMNHISNHHLIPKNDADERLLKRARPGDLLTLEGFLVDVDGTRLPQRTSLTRDDVGNGACEILLVERFTLERP